jgi:hypothetical protein
MRKPAQVAIRIRQAASLVAAFTLMLHIGLMALGAAWQPTVDHDVAASRHLHHHDDADGPQPGKPGKAAEHPQACCILSSVHGLPPAPSGSAWFPPRRVSALVVFDEDLASGAIRSLPPYPVGARAPPAVA